MDLTETQISKILHQYLKKKQYDKDYYQIKKKDKDFAETNRQQSLQYYHKNRDRKIEYQQKNREKYLIINSFNYYKRHNRVDDFKKKYPERFEKIVQMGKYNQ